MKKPFSNRAKIVYDCVLHYWRHLLARLLYNDFGWGTMGDDMLDHCCWIQNKASKIGCYESGRRLLLLFSAKVGGNQVKIDRVIVIDYYKLGSTGQDQDQFDRQGLFGLNLIRKR